MKGSRATLSQELFFFLHLPKTDFLAFRAALFRLTISPSSCHVRKCVEIPTKINLVALSLSDGFRRTHFLFHRQTPSTQPYECFHDCKCRFTDDAISVSPSPSSVFRATSDSSMHSCKFLSRKQSFLCT
uniref:Uncharacterized protein n=1 Tax=Parascaris univalens TaxID=6257 RepID=A0A915A2P7_PARUN